ncbi:MAG: gamma-glutamyltransferase family protein [Alphaproteobacteria bacterium]
MSQAEFAIGGGDRVLGAPFATRSPVLGRHGMAATAHPLATGIAIDILKRGGSAMDGAIAANAALGLMEPTGCGIGGDLFAQVWDPKTRQLYGYNGSGRSPLARDLTLLKTKLKNVAEIFRSLGAPYTEHIPPLGSLPVTVPGAVDGWFALHGKFGRLKMAEILAPAIANAHEGFPLTPVIAAQWRANMKSFERHHMFIEELDNARATYFINGRAPNEGDIFKNEDLAQSYELIAQGGRDAFYNGEIARRIDAYFKRIGGDLRAEDLARHSGEWVQPASVNYRGYDVFELPPNGQGLAALQMLKILEGFDLKSLGAGSAETLHLMIEAKRLAFEDVARHYADPDFYQAPIGWLISDEYARERRALIRSDAAMTDIGPGEARLQAGDTTYLTVADGDGMMVSLIQSNYHGMGSGLVPDGLGFMLQDRGELFSLEPGHANVYAAGKRPFHTIIPGFVMKDGQPLMSFGVMGGDMQPQGHMQVLTNIIDFGMNLQEAGDAARWRHFGSSEPTGEARQGIGMVAMESGFSEEARRALITRGHKLTGPDGSFGGYQAIWRDPKTAVYTGASEMRKDGFAAGY